MQYETSAIIEGTVVDIVKFGVFVKLAGGKTGLVHISQISDKYVQEISDHVALGAKILVKIILIDEKKRIQLSIKAITSEEENEYRRSEKEQKDTSAARTQQRHESYEQRFREAPAPPPDVGSWRQPPEEDNFERKMKLFIRQSEDRQVDIKRSIDSKRGIKRKKSK